MSMKEYAVKVEVIVEAREANKVRAMEAAEEYVHRLVTKNHAKPAGKKIAWVQCKSALVLKKGATE